jgi:hypothetical protein
MTNTVFRRSAGALVAGGWTETEATTFFQAAIPTSCPNAWG